MASRGARNVACLCKTRASPFLETEAASPRKGPKPQPSVIQTGTPDPATAPVVAGPTPTTATSAEIYQGFRAKRRELDGQLDRLVDAREELVLEIRQGGASDVDRSGLDARLAQTDQQIAVVTLQLAEAEGQVAEAAAAPGATIQPPDPPVWENGPPEEIVAMAIGFGALLLFPLVIAWARRIWRRSAAPPALPAELGDRIGAMERSVDAIAVEIERIGEGQRFVTQLLAERASGAAAVGGPEKARGLAARSQAAPDEPRS